MSADAEAIRRQLEPLWIEGTHELRVLTTSKGTVSGYFDSSAALAEAAARWSGQAPGVYWTINPAMPALQARASNRVIQRAKTTTSDSDILARYWIPFDFDPVRPAGISSTEEEHKAARYCAVRAGHWLVGLGIPRESIILADSGNGAHLLLRIDLPNTPETDILVRQCIEAVSVQFSDEHVSVDTACANAARIWKVYGTLAAKGDNTPARPHRLAAITQDLTPAPPVPESALARITAFAPPVPAPATRGRGDSFDIDRFVSSHLTVATSGPWQNGRKWVLDPCPFNPEHRNRSAVVIEHASGALAFRCHHNGCAGRSWADLRAMFEPKPEPRRETPPPGARMTVNAGAGSRTRPDLAIVPARTDTEMEELAAHPLAELMAREFPPPRYIIPDILPEGLTLLGGKAKKGKSWLALGWALAAAHGGVALGHIPVERNGVLYLWLEGGEALLQDRCRLLLGDDPCPPNFYYAAVSPTMDEDGIAILRRWLDQHPDIHFVIIDTLKHVRPRGAGRNMYDEDSESLMGFAQIGNEYRISLLVLHHLKKEPSEDDPFDEINGSSGLQAIPDTIMVLRGVRSKADAILHLTGRRIKDDQALALLLDKQSALWEVIGSAEDVNLRKERQDIIDVLAEHPEPMQPVEIAAVLGKHPVAVRVLLRKMVKAGEISPSTNGLYFWRDEEREEKTRKNGNTGNSGANPPTRADSGVTGVTGSGAEREKNAGELPVLPGGGNSTFGSHTGARAQSYRVTGVTVSAKNASASDEKTAQSVTPDDEETF